MKDGTGRFYPGETGKTACMECRECTRACGFTRVKSENGVHGVHSARGAAGMRLSKTGRHDAPAGCCGGKIGSRKAEASEVAGDYFLNPTMEA
jgi:hypothetical protein